MAEALSNILEAYLLKGLFLVRCSLCTSAGYRSNI